MNDKVSHLRLNAKHTGFYNRNKKRIGYLANTSPDQADRIAEILAEETPVSYTELQPGALFRFAANNPCRDHRPNFVGASGVLCRMMKVPVKGVSYWYVIDPDSGKQGEIYEFYDTDLVVPEGE